MSEASDRIPINCLCPMCKKLQTVQARACDLLAWKRGKLIQDAFPYLSDDEREALKTGICSTCWEKL